MIGFMLDMSRLDVQTPEHVLRHCSVDVSWRGTSAGAITTRLNIAHLSGGTVYYVAMEWTWDLVLRSFLIMGAILVSSTSKSYADIRRKLLNDPDVLRQ